MKKINLKVVEALQNDVGRGIVRLDSATREALGVTSGDIVAIKGKKKTGAIVWQSHPQDEKLGTIRMDGFLRKNTGVSIGEGVEVTNASVRASLSVTLAPLQPVRLGPGFEDYIKRRLVGRPIGRGDQILVGVFGTTMVFVAVSAKPNGLTQITEETEIILKEKPVKEIEKLMTLPRVTYEDVGGVDEEISKLREMIELPMKHPELFEKLGVSPPKGVLLYGPPGSGKTLLAKAVASESFSNFIHVNGPEIMSKFVGEAEERLRQIFKDAQDNAPTIIFMDEIDAIAPKRGEVVGEVERRVVAQLLTLMDGLISRGEVVVIAATNRQNAIDPALRRPGRFDREIELSVPDKEGRLNILQIHTRGMPLEGVDLEDLSSRTHGFVGADLHALAKEAAMKALRRFLPEINMEDESVSLEVLEALTVTDEDFRNALKEIRPSALREVFVEVPTIKFSDIGGLSMLKKELEEAIELPMKRPEVFIRMGIHPPRGIFIYGPPGCGKTLLAKAVASESNANFISVNGPEIMSKWVGESEKAVREIFRKARQVAPVIVFFDDLDSLALRRGDGSSSGINERVVNQLLTEMDGVEDLKDVVVMAASNRPDMVDPALLRPGRFDKLILVPPPDIKSRKQILEIHTKGMPIDKDVDLDEIAKITEGYSGADINGLVREAAMLAMREADYKQTKVGRRHFDDAIVNVKPSISQDDVQVYDGFSERRAKLHVTEKRSGYV